MAGLTICRDRAANLASVLHIKRRNQCVIVVGRYLWHIGQGDNDGIIAFWQRSNSIVIRHFAHAWMTTAAKSAAVRRSKEAS